MDTKIHHKTHKIVSVPPWVSNGTFWHQKVVPEGGYPLKIDQKSRVFLPRSGLRALKIARFLFEPEL